MGHLLASQASLGEVCHYLLLPDSCLPGVAMKAKPGHLSPDSCLPGVALAKTGLPGDLSGVLSGDLSGVAIA